MISITQIFSIFIGAVVIAKTIHDFRKRKESFIMSIFWIVTWLSIIVLAYFPILIEKINTMVGGPGNGIDTFIGAAFVFLFFVTYRVYVKANRLERQLHAMVMEIGIRSIDKE